MVGIGSPDGPGCLPFKRLATQRLPLEVEQPDSVGRIEGGQQHLLAIGGDAPPKVSLGLDSYLLLSTLAVDPEHLYRHWRSDRTWDVGQRPGR